MKASKPLCSDTNSLTPSPTTTLIEHRKRPLKGALAAFSKRFDKRLGVLLHFCLHAIAKHSHQSPRDNYNEAVPDSVFKVMVAKKPYFSHHFNILHY